MAECVVTVTFSSNEDSSQGFDPDLRGTVILYGTYFAGDDFPENDVRTVLNNTELDYRYRWVLPLLPKIPDQATYNVSIYTVIREEYTVVYRIHVIINGSEYIPAQGTNEYTEWESQTRKYYRDSVDFTFLPTGISPDSGYEWYCMDTAQFTMPQNDVNLRIGQRKSQHNLYIYIDGTLYSTQQFAYDTFASCTFPTVNNGRNVRCQKYKIGENGNEVSGTPDTSVYYYTDIYMWYETAYVITYVLDGVQNNTAQVYAGDSVPQSPDSIPIGARIDPTEIIQTMPANDVTLHYYYNARFRVYYYESDSTGWGIYSQEDESGYGTLIGYDDVQVQTEFRTLCTEENCGYDYDEYTITWPEFTQYDRVAAHTYYIKFTKQQLKYRYNLNWYVIQHTDMTARYNDLVRTDSVLEGTSIPVGPTEESYSNNIWDFNGSWHLEDGSPAPQVMPSSELNLYMDALWVDTLHNNAYNQYWGKQIVDEHFYIYKVYPYNQSFVTEGIYTFNAYVSFDSEQDLDNDIARADTSHTFSESGTTISNQYAGRISIGPRKITVYFAPYTSDYTNTGVSLSVNLHTGILYFVEYDYEYLDENVRGVLKVYDATNFDTQGKSDSALLYIEYGEWFDKNSEYIQDHLMAAYMSYHNNIRIHSVTYNPGLSSELKIYPTVDINSNTYWGSWSMNADSGISAGIMTNHGKNMIFYDWVYNSSKYGLPVAVKSFSPGASTSTFILQPYPNLNKMYRIADYREYDGYNSDNNINTTRNYLYYKNTSQFSVSYGDMPSTMPNNDVDVYLTIYNINGQDVYWYIRKHNTWTETSLTQLYRITQLTEGQNITVLSNTSDLDKVGNTGWRFLGWIGSDNQYHLTEGEFISAKSSNNENIYGDYYKVAALTVINVNTTTTQFFEVGRPLSEDSRLSGYGWQEDIEYMPDNPTIIHVT